MLNYGFILRKHLYQKQHLYMKRELQILHTHTQHIYSLEKIFTSHSVYLETHIFISDNHLLIRQQIYIPYNRHMQHKSEKIHKI